MTLYNRYWILESLAEFVVWVGVHSPLQIYSSYLVEIDLATGKVKQAAGYKGQQSKLQKGLSVALLLDYAV